MEEFYNIARDMIKALVENQTTILNLTYADSADRYDFAYLIRYPFFVPLVKYRAFIEYRYSEFSKPENKLPDGEIQRMYTSLNYWDYFYVMRDGSKEHIGVIIDNGFLSKYYLENKYILKSCISINNCTQLKLYPILA